MNIKKHPSFSHISIISGKINEAFLHRSDPIRCDAISAKYILVNY